jgi:hypothetical protein
VFVFVCVHYTIVFHNLYCTVSAFKIAPSGKTADFKIGTAQLFITVNTAILPDPLCSMPYFFICKF